MKVRVRALTLLEIVIASVLTLALVTAMVKWASVVQLLANGGTSRTEASRTATLLSARLGSDIDTAVGCDVLRRDRPFAALAPSELTLYSDSNEDGFADRVTWSIVGQEVRRTVEYGLGSCAFETAQPSTIVTNLVRVTSPAVFSSISGGAIAPVTARLSCTAAPTSCDFDAVRLTLTLNGDSTAPYLYEGSFPLDRRLYQGNTATVGTYVTTSIPAVTTTTLTSPTAPTISSITGAPSALSVAFSAPASTGGSTLLNYEYSTDNGTTWTSRTPAATTSPISITGLTNGTAYQVVIRAVNAIGSGAASSAVSGTPFTTPGAPSISSVTSAHLSLSVAFSAPASTGGSTLLNYEYSTDNGTTWTSRTPAATTSPISITGLTNGTAYQVRLRAVNAAGAGTASTAVAGTPQWSAMAASCSGCSSTTVVAGGRTYQQFTFSASGSMTITTPGSDASIDYLVVGAGGGGSTNGGNGGAGGSGGQTRNGSLAVTAGSYTATVGLGGAGSSTYNVPGATGGSSSFGSITATGGCSGAASGCGMYYYTSYNSGVTWRSGGSWVFYGGGGGAGAGGDGGAAPGNETGGAGGAGLTFWGAVYAGGGGGGGGSQGGTALGGTGGGGPGYGFIAGGNGASGSANTGGGGGGGYSSAGSGGSGIVIIRYAITAP